MSLGWRREQMRVTQPGARSIIIHRTARPKAHLISHPDRWFRNHPRTCEKSCYRSGLYRLGFEKKKQLMSDLP